MIITIDGPVASGKSTVSRILARELGYYYLCSGLLYRALGYLLINHHSYTLETIAHATDVDIAYCLDPDRFVYCYAPDTQERIFFDGIDITIYLKDRFMDKVSSIISVDQRVRHAITTIQRHIGSQYDLVIDGRDVGSVVFPYAEVKFFITASVAVRADRWRKDQEKYGNHFSHNDAVAIITDRDERDKNRTIAPLIIPQHAIIIDTSDLDVVQTIKRMVDAI